MREAKNSGACPWLWAVLCLASWLPMFFAAAEDGVEEAWIVGHRGDTAHWPENSIEGIRSAWRAGCAAEGDVRMSADGGLVLMHDETIDRTAVFPGRVSEMTLEELLQTDVGRRRSSRFWGVMVPALEVVLEEAREQGRKLVLHLKEPGTFRAVRDLAEAVGGVPSDLLMLVDGAGKREAQEVFGDSAYPWWVATGIQARHMTFGSLLRDAETGVAGLLFLYYEGGPSAFEIDLVRDLGLKFGYYAPSGGSDVPEMIGRDVDLVLNNFPRRAMRLVSDQIWQQWKEEHGVVEFGEGSDPNGDGVAMLTEFATGLAPLGDGGVKRTGSAVGEPVVFPRRVAVVDVSAEWSTDLLKWLPGRRPAGLDGYQRWRVRRY